MLQYAKTIVLTYISAFVGFLRNTLFNSTDKLKYVGLQIVSKLYFQENIDYIFSKSVKILGLNLFINFCSSTSFILLMFCDTRAKPKLEYDLIVWNSVIPTDAKTWNMISKISYPWVKNFLFS